MQEIFEFVMIEREIGWDIQAKFNITFEDFDDLRNFG